MKSLRFLDRRAGFSLGAIGLLLGVIAPTVMPAFASADLLASRSITMSSSTAGATDTSYVVKFTSPAGISGVTSGSEGGVVIEFCSNTPLIGSTCDHPTGMATKTNVTLALGDVKYNTSDPASDGTVSSPSDGVVMWKAGTALTGGTPLTLQLDGITNPDSTVKTFYARITTYDTNVATEYTAADDLGSYVDEGGVALSNAATVGVHAYVLESMTFCVAKGDVGDTGNASQITAQGEPSENCGANEADCTLTNGVAASGCVVAPDMTIGQQTGTVTALSTSAVSTGEVYAQLSTNAGEGAVVNLKSDAANCGGLYRDGTSSAANCGIAPQTTALSSITAGDSKFGLKVGTATVAPKADGSGGTGSGDDKISAGGSYDGSNFFMDYTDSTSGVTSPYGSELFEASDPVNNVNVPITFGASISNTTPAGVYGANFNLIAVGKF